MNMHKLKLELLKAYLQIAAHGLNVLILTVFLFMLWNGQIVINING